MSKVVSDLQAENLFSNYIPLKIVHLDNLLKVWSLI